MKTRSPSADRSRPVVQPGTEVKSSQRINEIANRRRGITPAAALRLAEFFGTSADFWIHLQLRWDLYQAQQSDQETLSKPFHAACRLLQPEKTQQEREHTLCVASIEVLALLQFGFGAMGFAVNGGPLGLPGCRPGLPCAGSGRCRRRCLLPPRRCEPRERAAVSGGCTRCPPDPGYLEHSVSSTPPDHFRYVRQAEQDSNSWQAIATFH